MCGLYAIMQSDGWCLLKDDACCLENVLSLDCCSEVLRWAQGIRQHNPQRWVAISQALQLDVPPEEAWYKDLTDALTKHPAICQQIRQAFPTASAFQIKDLKIICSSASKGHGSQVPHADCLVPDGAFGIVHLQDQSETTLFVPRDKRLGALNKPRGVVECCHCKRDRVPSQQAWIQLCSHPHSQFDCGMCTEPAESPCVAGYACFPPTIGLPCV